MHQWFFQKAMNSMLGHSDFVRVYLDDIIIISIDEVTHSDHVKTVINILYENGCSINYSKSQFFIQEKNFWDT